VGPAGPTSLAGRPGVGAFSNSALPTCQGRSVHGVSNAESWCSHKTWPPGHPSWPVGLTSGAQGGGGIVDKVSEALSMHEAPPTIQIVVVPAGVTVLLGLHNPPCSWTGMVGPSLPGFTIAPCLDFLLCDRLIRGPKSILQDSPKI
jgi:hypothetical protein